MNRKIRVAILFGGRSAEHEVSLQSAKNIIDAIDRDKYDVVLIGIDRDGAWRLTDGAKMLDAGIHDTGVPEPSPDDPDVALVPGRQSEQFISLTGDQPAAAIDVVFPVLHGPFGEDGTVQGLLKLANIPFVGAGVLGSAVGMDKDVMKRLLRDAGIPVGRFRVFHKFAPHEPDFEAVAVDLGLPLFIKPANLGSSVGIHKVTDATSFRDAIADAFSYDRKILVEEFIEGREIECSVLGNDQPTASVPGEILPKHEFYSYEAKYLDENGAVLEIPAKLDLETSTRIHGLAVQTFRALCCEGMARVDFFLKKNGEIIVNEINTIPGFTRISMYPKLWEASGIGYGELIDRLIELAVERHEREATLRAMR